MFRFLGDIFHPPELEKVSEEEYDRLVWQARYRRGDAIWVIPLLSGILAAAAWGGIAWLLTLSFRAFAGGQLISQGLGRWVGVNIIVACLFFIAGVMLTRWTMIVRSIRIMLNRAACPFCDFSLVGLTISDGAVKCPECGQRVVLHEHRIHEADITIPRPFDAAGERGAYRAAEKREKRNAKGQKSAAGTLR